MVGFQETLNALENVPDEVGDVVDAEIGATCATINKKQVQRVQVDNGQAKNATRYGQTGRLKWEIVSLMPYAAYLNWGTITKVSVDAGWQEIARKFKGKGIRKTGGVMPSFFFTGPINEEVPKLIKRLKQVINK